MTIILVKLKPKENKRYFKNVSAIVGVGIATAIIGGGLGGLIYSSLIRAAGAAGAFAFGEFTTGTAVAAAGAASAAGTAGATGAVLITNSIDNARAANPDKFGFISLITVLSKTYSGASLIDENTNENDWQDSSERDDIQTLEIEEFKVKDSIDKCMNNSLE